MRSFFNLMFMHTVATRQMPGNGRVKVGHCVMTLQTTAS